MTRSLVPVLLLLTACSDRTPQAAPSPAVAKQADTALIARMAALPPGQLNLVLFRAIRDAGQPCQGIAASRRLDDQGGRPAWSAQCDRGDGQYLLVLNPGGQMTVTPGEAYANNR